MDIRPQVSRLQRCTVMPSLPEGIVIDPACAISGKPMKSAPNMSYTITAMSENGSISTVISIVVRDSPYDKSHYSFVRGMFGTTGIPTTTEPVSSWTVTPSLPNGLMMNVETGEISGIPRVSIEEMEYTITAMSENGSISTVISIEVRDSPYDKSHYSFVRGMFGTTTGIPTTTEPVSSWTVTPSLPYGLMMNVDNGEISGIPRVSIEEMEYTITAMSENGSLSTVISIEVRDSPYDKKPIKVGTILRNWYLASYVISFVVAVVFAIVMVIRKKKATRSAAVETKELMV